MLRAETVIPAGAWSGEPVDSVVLDFDERHRRRVAMTGVRGLDFLLDLPEAVALRAGDGLALDDGRVVEVVAAPEPLAEIRAAHAEARRKAETLLQEKMKSLTGGLQLPPGMKLF